MGQAEPKPHLPSRWWRISSRTIMILILAATVGWILNRISISLDHSQRPAGFARGILQGALMPMALPNLLVGNDVTIYARNNTGLGYKLGYTAGVNGCGTIFFGFLFWRISRWKNGKSNRAG